MSFNSEADIKFMRQALILAQQAAAQGEVPVGALIVAGNTVIAQGANRREESQNALDHAELIAIKEACAALGSWRLTGCTLYVTLEPCPMCAGAIIHSRIPRVVFGAFDVKGGGCGGVLNVLDPRYNHHPEVTGGVLEEECATVLRDFFKARRNGA